MSALPPSGSFGLGLAMGYQAAPPPPRVSCFAPPALAMILLTGATGVVGSALLHRLLEEGEEVRCLVRDPRRLGANRVRVHITLGDLANPVSLRQAVRGAPAVVHLAAAIRDQRERRSRS